MNAREFLRTKEAGAISPTSSPFVDAVLPVIFVLLIVTFALESRARPPPMPAPELVGCRRAWDGRAGQPVWVAAHSL